MNRLPQARAKNIIERHLEGETLIYDTANDNAYRLNETSAIVYRACNGVTTFEELERKHRFTKDLIFLALDGLKARNLLQEPDRYVSPFTGLNRREVIKKVGLACAVALPLISGLVAPSAANAASGACRTVTQSCSFDNYTQSNCCTNTLRCTPDSGGTTYTCRNCLGSGASFATVNNATPATCDAQPQKNYCCNTTSSATANGSNCNCP